MKQFRKILEIIKKIILPQPLELTLERFNELEQKKYNRRGDF